MKSNQLNCREEHRREEIVEKYNIKLIAHTKLLKGQDKISCAGAKCTNKYYTFQYENKKDKYDNGSFFCGAEAAKSFIRLANLEPIKIFNPLSGENTRELDDETPHNENSTEGTDNSAKDDDYKNKWNPTAKQLHTAINLIIVCWDIPIYGKLARYKADVMKYKYREPFFERIEFVNDVIAKDKKNRTLTQMVDDLRTDNPTLKHFNFDLLEEKLTVKGIKSNF
ncbi:hypothetical protein [Lysinibacillus sp. K60]|uniref:hypothetical protein n=1 Tax=Lysinibacillus sp. K60 TaxID=2720027 RepID=UPI001C8C2ACE|nr:hypothetical protein [Lysinibacillus sp. K60]MBX8945870.1 hypothetical protein [Lysinibacillus sp. K60]